MKQRSHLHLPSRPESGSIVQRRPRFSPATASLLTLAALLLALAAIACSQENAKIAFISDRDGNEELYVMNADDSDVIRLTDTDGHISGYPRWSPDGQRIAFASDQDGNDEIYLANADGSGLARLTHSDRSDSNPAWSPDGQRIAFVSGHSGDLEGYLKDADRSDFADRGRVKLLGSFDIYLMNADGSGLTQLTDDAGRDFNPSWSPDGQRIVFISDRDGDSDIYTMNADGSGSITKLTHDVEIATPLSVPQWSSDGQCFFFTWPSGADRMIIYMMNPDGSDLT